MTKNNLPNRFPKTICNGVIGVVNRMSQVFGFASLVIAPARNKGVKTQIRINCEDASRVNTPALPAASSRSENCPPVIPVSPIKSTPARRPR